MATTDVIASPPDQARLLDLYRRMLLIRRFEEQLEGLADRGALAGVVHLYIGQEATAVGVCAALRSDDVITSTHRGHGHLIAKGADVRRMMAELFGKATGQCQGKGGSMHIADFSLGILGACGIVGGGIPVAVGAALGFQLQGSDRVAVAFFGDGASNEGSFHESLNLAAVMKLPVVFVCEDNGFCEFDYGRKTSAVENLAVRAASYAIPGIAVDGNDVLAVSSTTAAAVERARQGQGPTLLVAETYRFGGHSVGEREFLGGQRYRSDEEVELRRAADPVTGLGRQLTGSADLDAIDREVRAVVEDSVRFAESSPYPDLDVAFADVFFEAVDR
jgi:pyruvate dehydrogenase E1 component alpha subunit